MIDVKNLYFRYPNVEYDIIRNANFQINKGDFVFIFGPSGSGKSTLLYSLVGLIPWSIEGYFKGNVSIFGNNIRNIKPNKIAGTIALLMQDPDNQFINLSVYDELIFGAENLKVNKNEIINRLNETVKLLHLENLLDRNVLQLSGGEKLRVILGAILIMKPKILILDEPLSSLDAKGRVELMNYLFKIHREDKDLIILIVEHRVKDIYFYANKFIFINQGNVQVYDDPKEIDWKIIYALSEGIELNQQKISEGFNKSTFSYSSIMKAFDFNLKNRNSEMIDEKIKPNALITFKNVSFHYIQDRGKSERQINNVFQNISFIIQPGDIIGMLGPNGSGKTTLLYLIACILYPSSGEIYYKDKKIDEIPYGKYAKNIGLIFQNPESQILKRTIINELLFGPKNFGMMDKITEQMINNLINLIFGTSLIKTLKKKLDKDSFKDLNPFHLSWGQQRRLNIASIYTYAPDIYLLDEPFSGQDLKRRLDIMKMLKKVIGNERAAIIATHDEEILDFCSKAFLISDKNLQIYEKQINTKN